MPSRAAPPGVLAVTVLAGVAASGVLPTDPPLHPTESTAGAQSRVSVAG
jgi:hypothetical protein